MPYKCRSDKIYVALQRGDGVLAQGKPKQMRLFDGMVGNLIDVNDWKGPVVLSDYNMGETCWIELPRSEKDKAIAQMAQFGNDPTQSSYRRTTDFVDYQSFAPQVSSQCPDFLTKVYEHKFRLPMLKLGTICNGWLKKCKNIKPRIKALIPDVGQITAGSYTVGPGGGDNYPTYGGAGGFAAALGNLTGNIDGTNTGNITETALASFTINNGGFQLLIDSNTPPLGDPTVGHVVTLNGNFHWLYFNNEGPGDTICRNLHSERTGAPTDRYASILILAIVAAHDIAIYSNLFDGAGVVNANGIRVIDDTPVVHIYNNCIWGHNGSANSVGISSETTNASNIYANNSIYSNTRGIDLTNDNCTCRNNGSLGNSTNDFQNIGSATGRNNHSLDLTAANANWNVGTGNVTGTAAGAWQSVNDAQAAFLDITSGGAFDGGGVANVIARATCIRGRAVPGPNGTSVGAAEEPPAENGSSATGAAILRGSHIGIHSGVGVF